MKKTRPTIDIALAIAITVGGAALALWLVNSRPVPPVRSTFAEVAAVAVQPIEPTSYQLPVTGYGTVRAKNQVNIVPQVSGQLVFSHGALLQGKIIPEGEVLFKIDPVVYESRVKQVQAEIRGLEAALARSAQEMINLDDRIVNAEQMLDIEKRDYDISKNLFDVDQVGTRRDLDLVYQKYLRQKDVTTDLRGRRAMAPHVDAETRSKLDAARARLGQAEHDLDSTVIRCPFRARVETVSAYSSQVVTAHFSVATLTDMDAFEVSVGIDPRDLQWLNESIQPEALEGDVKEPRPEVQVKWSLPGRDFVWRGFVTRFERVDEATRTARMIVEVRELDMASSASLDGIVSGPMLSIGMYCRADLPCRKLNDALLVPRHAIYDNRWVYVVEPDPQSADGATGRLGRRRVPMLRSVADRVLVDYAGRDASNPCDLQAGEQVVISPMVRPVMGMKVAIRETRLAQHPNLTSPDYTIRLASSD